MKLKVCGMRDDPNIQDLVSINPDFIGFIFYEKSGRYVGERTISDVPRTIKRVGVFVNPSVNLVLKKVADFKLDIVQLHGSESVDFVSQLKKSGLTIIKVFSVMNTLPLEVMSTYEPVVDFFLFDTKTPGYGGSGRKFDWSLLDAYNLDKPYFLSGGIDLEDIEAIRKLKAEKLYAIDVNSRFEIQPGIKNIEKLEELKNKLIQSEPGIS